ncbi:MAG: hypothetical protein IPL32_08810 [Chloracidobacterium sp.]|nr:hypothetical protein [Chloracidobacterium sp.]
MESDYQIVLKGMSDEIASIVSEAVAKTIHNIELANENLDLRRIERIIICTDFAGELQNLSASTASGNPITHTSEEYATAVAKVLLLPKNGDFEIVPVINANIIAILGLGDQEKDSDAIDYVTHLLHHELCHVHDDNKKIDAYRDDMLRTSYVGKDMFIRPLAEVSWSEYVANRLSSQSATTTAIELMTSSFIDALDRTKVLVDAEIKAYRHHADLERLLVFFQRHGEFLVKTASYVLGYVDGLQKPLETLSPIASKRISGSYFEETWQGLHVSLNDMYKEYPGNWKDLTVYDELTAVLETYYDNMGLVLSTTADNQAYLNVPFR